MSQLECHSWSVLAGVSQLESLSWSVLVGVS